MKDATERRTYDNNWYASRNSEWRKNRRAQANTRRKLIRVTILKRKLKNPCRCGESHPACLEFHHIRGPKLFDIAVAERHGYALEKLEAEMDKCVILCANCHRKEHARLK